MSEGVEAHITPVLYFHQKGCSMLHTDTRFFPFMPAFFLSPKVLIREKHLV